MFITLYGVNNIGKSTHARLLTEKLNKSGFSAVYRKYPIYELEPSGVYLNELIRSPRQQVSEEELQTWFLLNRLQYQPVLQKLLAQGKIVVSEDYTWTGIAWGAAKGGDPEWLKTINKPLIKEDLAILLHGQRQIAAVENNHIHENDETILKRCQEYLLLFAVEKDWLKIEIQPTIEATAALIWKEVQKHIANK